MGPHSRTELKSDFSSHSNSSLFKCLFGGNERRGGRFWQIFLRLCLWPGFVPVLHCAHAALTPWCCCLSLGLPVIRLHYGSWDQQSHNPCQLGVRVPRTRNTGGAVEERSFLFLAKHFNFLFSHWLSETGTESWYGLGSPSYCLGTSGTTEKWVRVTMMW